VSDRNLKWDRQELYEKVWQFPNRKLAAEYNVSDVGLAKIGHKLKIPLPGLGHWTKIACGHTIPQPPLPAMEIVPVCRLVFSTVLFASTGLAGSSCTKFWVQNWGN